MSVFLLKKLVSRALFPLPLCLAFLLIGLLFLWFTHRKKTGHACLVLGVVLLFLFSYAPSSSRLLRPLEFKYPAFHADFMPGVDAPLEQAGPVWICVPGSSWTPDPSIPVTSRMDPFFAERMLEAARVSHMFTHAHLIVGMASPGTLDDKNRFQNAYAALTGLTTNRVILVNVNDTQSEIQQMKTRVGDDEAVMVSTASHIPRVMTLCQRYGLRATAAPCGHRTLKGEPNKDPRRLDEHFPNAVSLSRSERAVYEYLGIAWERIKAAWASLL